MNATSTMPGLVSVIVPCYNRAHLVVETLESVAAQTYSPVELIVVDDGSTDDSVAVVQRWAETRGQSHANIVRFHCLQQANAGPSAARNHGFRESTGEFVQFLDSDDLLEPGKLKEQVGVLTSDLGLDYCVCNYFRVNATNTSVLREVQLDEYSHTAETLPASYPMNSVTPVYRRRIVARIGGYDPALWAAEDFEFNFRMMLQGRGQWIRQTLVRCRIHEGPERIQARGYSRHFQHLALGLLKMELSALSAAACTPRLLFSLAQRALAYERVMRSEAEPAMADYFRRHARARVTWTQWLGLRLRQQVTAWRKRRDRTGHREA